MGVGHICRRDKTGKELNHTAGGEGWMDRFRRVVKNQM